MLSFCLDSPSVLRAKYKKALGARLTDDEKAIVSTIATADWMAESDSELPVAKPLGETE